MTEQITEELIEQYRTWKADSVAVIYDARLKDIERTIKSSFTEIGLIGVEVKQRELWRMLTNPKTSKVYESWNQYITTALPCSARSAFEAVTVAEQCADIPPVEREKIDRSNLSVMSRLSPDVRRQVVERAKTMPANKFVEMIEEEFPNQHIESKAEMRFNFDKSQRKAVEAVLVMAMKLEGCKSYEEAFEEICEHYRDTRQADFEQWQRESTTIH